MTGGIIFFTFPIWGAMLLMMWNKIRTRGKMLAFFTRKDKSVVPALCELRDAFVIWGNRAYDIYPDFVRVMTYPMGWPSFLQERVPACLYDEEEALPKDWVTLQTPKEGSLKLRSALEENWVKKLVQESAAEGQGFKINFRKVLPILLMVGGAIGLLMLLTTKGCQLPQLVK